MGGGGKGKGGGGRLAPSFSTDFSAVGTSRSQSNIFAGGSGSINILEEERRLIDKVFSIVDCDNSGMIDAKELEEMFKLFGVETQFLTNAISRIMSNVDKDHDGMISPQEFYQLLSQKFEKGDLRKDIDAVFHRMNKTKDGELKDTEIAEVSQMLGENMPRAEIKEMIKMFSLDYQKKLATAKKDFAAKTKNKASPALVTEEQFKGPPSPRFLTIDDFYECMQEDL